MSGGRIRVTWATGILLRERHYRERIEAVKVMRRLVLVGLETSPSPAASVDTTDAHRYEGARVRFPIRVASECLWEPGRW